MNDLADRITKVHPSQDYFTCTHEEREQIIAALRQNDLAQTEIKGHMRTIDDLKRDLQLAIAHDRQPYPTAAAYETLCEAHRKAKARISELELQLAASDAVMFNLSEEMKILKSRA
jgi:hypothetical protein